MPSSVTESFGTTMFGYASGANAGCVFKYLNAPTDERSLGSEGTTRSALSAVGVNIVPDARIACLADPSSRTNLTLLGSANASGDVLSEHETLNAATTAAAEQALKRVNRDENPVERRIVTLVWRVTYKTTTHPKLNRSYGLLYALNPLS